MTPKKWTALTAVALLAAPLLGSAALAEDAAKAEKAAATEPAAAEEAAVTEEAAEAGEAKGTVARAAFTTAVVDREPQDDLDALANDHDKVYFFTELHGLAGEQVTHRWEYNGQVMAEVTFDVGADRWRTHSSKNLQPIWLGDWTVTVVDSDENVLARHEFQYKAADTSMPAAPAE